jgi:hypothetical protein
MNINLSLCGCECGECAYLLNSQCAGCEAIKGKAWWTRHIGEDVCPVYHCAVLEKKIGHCGRCAELPCRLYYDLKDPAITDEEHLKGITVRANKLKNLSGRSWMHYPHPEGAMP